MPAAGELAPQAYDAAMLDALDLEPIKFKLVTESGWSLEKADAVELIYKGFLHLCGMFPDDSPVPSAEIDEMWHAHILDTRKYHDDCERIFGRFIHHFPYAGMLGNHSELESDFARTKALFRQALKIDLDVLTLPA